MLKKIGSRILVLASVGLLLAACQPANTDKTDKSDSKTAKVYTEMDEFAKAVKEANKEMISVQSDTKLELYQGSKTPQETVTMLADIVYQKEEIVMTKASIESANGGKVISHQELIMVDDESLYVRQSEDGDYTKTELKNMDLNPDYFDVLSYLYRQTDDLALKEDGDDYLVTLENEDLSLISTFGKEYKFTLTGSFDESDAQKELTLRFDKKTLFMKEFQASLNLGNDMVSMKVSGDTEFSDWNQIRAKDIQAPK